MVWIQLRVGWTLMLGDIAPACVGFRKLSLLPQMPTNPLQLAGTALTAPSCHCREVKNGYTLLRWTNQST
jgi:hypothetical protein